MFAIRQGRWKLIEGLGSGGYTKPARTKSSEDGVEIQLYDLESDPSESIDLARTHPEKTRELLQLLEEIRAADGSVERADPASGH